MHLPVKGFLRSLREKGIAPTLRYSALWMMWNARAKAIMFRWNYRGMRFDTQCGTDTTARAIGLKRNRDAILQRISSPHRDEVTGFYPVDPVLAENVIAGLEIDYPDFTFLDIGSGTGRAVLVASQFPFRRIVGVELSRELHLKAEENLRCFYSSKQKCQDLQLICADASQYPFPDDPLVIYLFNPFGEKVMSQVLANLAASYKQNPRPLVIVYWRPRLDRMLLETGFLQRVQTYDIFVMDCYVYRSLTTTAGSFSATVADRSRLQ